MKCAALVLPFLPAFLLAACSTPAYVDQGRAERAGVLDFNPVVFQVYAAFGAQAPDCVAVLPLASADVTPVDAVRVRLSLYTRLLARFRRGIRPEQVDQALAEVGGDRKALGERLNCAALLEGTVTEAGATYLGFYSSVTVGADLRLVRAADGAVLWQGRHVAAARDGGLPLDPVGVALGLYGALDNIRDEQVLRVTDDLTRRLVSTIPDTTMLTEADKPAAPDAETWFAKGRALALSGKYAEAETAIARAAALAPADPRVLNALGALAADRGDAPRALAAYRRAIDADPANGFAWYQSGVLLDEGGETAEAADAFYGAALAYLKSGDRPRAGRALDQMRRLSDPRAAAVETVLSRRNHEES